MEDLTVKTKTKEYPITFSRGFDNLGSAIEKLGLAGQKMCVITDENVKPLYAEIVEKELKTVSREVLTYSFPAGEKEKNLDTIQNFYSFFQENHFDRKDVIVGLGGGVVGDMAGFAAATYLRGVPFIQIPTTLLAQVDSSVGGKVGVDFKKTKNMIGAFYQPELVYMNAETLHTLPEREFSAGMGEVIKYGIIVSHDFYDWFWSSLDTIKAKDEDTMEKMIYQCCKFKADVVSEDEKESGLREILNFGHTIGHAIESMLGFQFLHGECVALGMRAVLYLSMQRGDIKKEELEGFEKLLKEFSLPLKADGLAKESVYNQMFYDKKVKNGKIGFVLAKSMGEVYRTTDVTVKEILDAIAYVL